MRALCWYGKRDVRVERVAEPMIINPRDAIVAVSSAGICGPDLLIYNGHAPAMRAGDILGREFVGEIVDVGPKVEKVRTGDRVVVSSGISCGACWYCKREEWSLCDNTNPNAWMAEKLFGYSPAGAFGSSHLLGGYAGGQAEYIRVPFADVGCMKVDSRLEDARVLLLSDTLPVAYMAVEQAEIQKGDVVAIWGCGPVGQLAARCAWLFEPERVIAVDEAPARLRMARDRNGAEVIDSSAGTGAVRERLGELTGGRGPDAVIDGMGIEANGHGSSAILGRMREAAGFDGVWPGALREAVRACRKGGRVSVAGAYPAFADKTSLAAANSKGLTFEMGQAHVQRYMRPLYDRIERGDLDASFVVTHRLVLSDAPAAYDLFDQADGCVKVLLEP